MVGVIGASRKPMSRQLRFKAPSAAKPSAVADPATPATTLEDIELLSFAAEGTSPGGDTKVVPAPKGAAPSVAKPALIAAAVLVAAGVAAGIALFNQRVPPTPATVPPATGMLTVDSRPRGADVIIGGVLQGTTPLKVSLPVGCAFNGPPHGRRDADAAT